MTSESFTYSLPRQTTCQMSSDTWTELKAKQNGRYFAKGKWQNIFSEIIKQSNVYCSFVFKHHSVSTSAQPRGVLFNASGKCAFTHCPVSVKLVMKSPNTVIIYYTGDVTHSRSEMHGRPIRGEEREKLRKEFRMGIKPLQKYINILNDSSNELLVSGNVDGLGKDTHVFQQISTESRQHRLAKD